LQFVGGRVVYVAIAIMLLTAYAWNFPENCFVVCMVGYIGDLCYLPEQCFVLLWLVLCFSISFWWLQDEGFYFMDGYCFCYLQNIHI